MINVYLHMEGEIVGYSYANIVLHFKDNRKVIDLNRKLMPLPISLSFWVRLILGFYLRLIVFPLRGPYNSPIV